MEIEIEALKAFMMFRRRRTSEFEEYEKIERDVVVARMGKVAVIRIDDDVYIFVMKSAERAEKLIELVKKLYSVFNDVMLTSIADNLVEAKEIDELSDDEYEYTFVYEL